MVELPVLATAALLGEKQAHVVRPHRFTVDDLVEMLRAGVLGEDDRIELIHGVLIEMPPIGDAHIFTTNVLARALTLGLGDAALVSVQNPVRLGESLMPQPDIAVLRPELSRERRSPRADDVILVVEVSDTTLTYDRTVKLPLYAEAGISEVWIINLPERQIEVYREAGPGGYKSMRRFLRGETVAPEAFPDVVIAADLIL